MGYGPPQTNEEAYAALAAWPDAPGPLPRRAHCILEALRRAEPRSSIWTARLQRLASKPDAQTFTLTVSAAHTYMTF